jgi:hypothetical protein
MIELSLDITINVPPPILNPFCKSGEVGASSGSSESSSSSSAKSLWSDENLLSVGEKNYSSNLE